MAFTSYISHDLDSSEIESLGKAFILRKFHKHIRLWYIEKKLPPSLLSDPDIVPFFTPCNGHVEGSNPDTLPTDVIDGIFVMQAYCPRCVSNGSTQKNHKANC